MQYSHDSSQSDHEQQAGKPVAAGRARSRASDKTKRAFIIAYLLMFMVVASCGAILIIEPSTKLPLLSQYNAALHVYADSMVANGTSEAQWIKRHHREWQCLIDDLSDSYACEQDVTLETI